MRIFITAGNTQALIDRVRCITNIFTGRTGARIALEAHRRGHDVTFATSHPETVDTAVRDSPRFRLATYRTFEALDAVMAEQIGRQKQDAVVHCAAVNDYRTAGVFAPASTTHFAEDGSWQDPHQQPRLVDRAAGKVKSDEPELWLRLVRTPKLVDRIRTDWRFGGVLVKFKLEVGVTEDELKQIAETSRQQSQADWIVANTLDGASDWALLGNGLGYERVTRDALASTLLDALEKAVRHG